MLLFPTVFGMEGNHEFKLVGTPIIEANTRCFELRLRESANTPRDIGVTTETNLKQ